MTVCSKRSDAPRQLASAKSRLPVKRSSATKSSRLASAFTTLEILDEATKMLQPLSLDEDCESTAHSFDDSFEYQPTPLQPDDRRRRMLRRGSKCPQMFFQDLQSWKCGAPDNISLPSLVLQGSTKSKLLVLQKGSKFPHPQVFKQYSTATAETPSDMQATQEGAKAA